MFVLWLQMLTIWHHCFDLGIYLGREYFYSASCKRLLCLYNIKLGSFFMNGKIRYCVHPPIEIIDYVRLYTGIQWWCKHINIVWKHAHALYVCFAPPSTFAFLGTENPLHFMLHRQIFINCIFIYLFLQFFLPSFIDLINKEPGDHPIQLCSRSFIIIYKIICWLQSVSKWSL